MRYILIVLLVILMALSFSGCVQEYKGSPYDYYNKCKEVMQFQSKDEVWPAVGLTNLFPVFICQDLSVQPTCVRVEMSRDGNTCMRAFVYHRKPWGR
jgi:hypothetical protein